MQEPSPATTARPSDSELVASLAKLWPHREHESNSIKNLFCAVGLHRWRQLDLRELYPGKNIQFCFWCSKIKVDGIDYGG
jgi:hypothetical protein